MAQWYPKIAEYDLEGWNADPYIGREFHGVWGNFDVKITQIKILWLLLADIFKTPTRLVWGTLGKEKTKNKKR